MRGPGGVYYEQSGGQNAGVPGQAMVQTSSPDLAGVVADELAARLTGEVTAADLQKISEELWETPIYGNTAAGLLDEERRDFTKDSAMQIRPLRAAEGGGEHREYRATVSMPRLVRTTVEGSYTVGQGSFRQAERQYLEDQLRLGWPEGFLFEPATLSTKMDRGLNPDTGLRLEERTMHPGPVTVPRLAWYVQASGIADSEQIGAIGKAHAVIEIAAGLATRDAIAAKTWPEQEFIEYADFRTMLETADLSVWSRRRISRTLDAAVREQIQRGKRRSVWRLSPVVVEGQGVWMQSGGRRVLRFERIGRSGLATLFDCPGENPTAAADFLAQFAPNPATNRQNT